MECRKNLVLAILAALELKVSPERLPQNPKLYVLGGMEELGDSEVELHESVGASLKLETNDLVVLIGRKAAWYASDC